MQQKNYNQYKSWLISAGIVVIVALWLVSGQFRDEEATPIADAPASDKLNNAVRVRTQTAELVQRTITVNGKTAPARTVALAAQTEGRIDSVGAERGSNMKRGELIVRLDERDRTARLLQSNATVKQREVEYEARLKLKSSSYVSESQLQEAIALLEMAKTELTRANLDLSYMSIRAPFGGALQDRAVEVGDFVKVGDPIATYVDNQKIIVSANLSEFDARYVNVGDSAVFHIAGYAVNPLV